MAFEAPEFEPFRTKLGAQAGRFITRYLEQRASAGDSLPFIPAKLLGMRDPYLGLSIFAITAFHRLLYRLAIEAAADLTCDTPRTIEEVDLEELLANAQCQIETLLPDIIESMLAEANVEPRWRPLNLPKNLPLQ